MSINSVSPHNPLNELAALITRKLDRDQDGKISTDEFATYLARLMDGKTDGLNTTAASRPAATGAVSSPASSTRDIVGTLGGYDPTKLANASHQTFKYQIGRILQHYPNTPQGLKDALPEIQTLVPGAKIIGTNGDKIDFGSYVDDQRNRIGVVDVLQAAAAGGKSWQWLPIE